jgi:hypothetical protein
MTDADRRPAPAVCLSLAHAEIAEFARRAPQLDFRVALARASVAALLDAARRDAASARAEPRAATLRPPGPCPRSCRGQSTAIA